jgi:hypothetical protein
MNIDGQGFLRKAGLAPLLLGAHIDQDQHPYLDLTQRFQRLHNTRFHERQLRRDEHRSRREGEGLGKINAISVRRCTTSPYLSVGNPVSLSQDRVEPAPQEKTPALFAPTSFVLAA